MRVYSIVSSCIISLILINCSGSKSSALSLEDCGKNGNFCYKGFNYGPVTSPLFKKGVKDGCRTAEGFFTKDYTLSSSSKEYYNGWIEGRSHCKQILPNEGTRQEEENSRKRAEYEINKLKQEQSPKVEESFFDALFGSDDEKEESLEEVEY
jgi:hypothetical protein